MGAETGIAWTDHTFNAWWGCQQVSEGCKHCYAETWSKRVGLKIWGQDTDRRFFGDKHWNEPLAWNRAAEKAGVRRRVFCSSMADVFEDRPDLAPHRARLFALTQRTPWLDWQLLTKRPENAQRLWNAAQHDAFNGADSLGPLWAPSVWLDTTVENQKRADERIPHLLAVPAAVRFLSCEPLLEDVRIAHLETRALALTMAERLTGATGTRHEVRGPATVGWIIGGGESGPGARPFNRAWMQSLVSQGGRGACPGVLQTVRQERRRGVPRLRRRRQAAWLSAAESDRSQAMRALQRCGHDRDRSPRLARRRPERMARRSRRVAARVSCGEERTMTYAHGTTVPVSRSRAELDELLKKHSASQRVFADDDEKGLEIVVFALAGRQYRLEVPLPKREAFLIFTKQINGAPRRYQRTPEDVAKVHEQACRERWRAIVLLVKAKLETIAIGLSTVEQEFFANLQTYEGKSLYEVLRHRISANYETGAPLLGPEKPVVVDAEVMP